MKPAQRHPHSRYSPLAAGFGIIAGAAGLALAAHHPLSAWGTVVLVVGLMLASARWPLAWLFALPAALPTVGAMPWSGWLTFEEMDLLVLALATGAYAHLAAGRPLVPFTQRAVPKHSNLLVVTVWLVYGLALMVSMGLGFADAGGFRWGWWHGYHEPMNSIRLAKSVVWVLLLAPLWVRVVRVADAEATALLSRGLAAGLAVIGLLALWERSAYTGLLNFSTDYRTTALFWEMHVGGAALDGSLALLMPFALQEALRPQNSWRWGLAVAGLLLGAYAGITTFSRAVYLALPLGCALFLLLRQRQAHRGAGAVAAESSWKAAVVLLAAFSSSALIIFPSSGYRGLLALLGAYVVMLPMVQVVRGLTLRQATAGMVAGVGLAVVLLALGLMLPKGPYLVYALAWAVVAATVAVQWRTASLAAGPGAAVVAVAAAIALVPLMPWVAWYWGGDRATLPMILASAVLGIVAAGGATGRHPRWPTSWRWQGLVVAAMGSVALLVGVMSGGAYMSDRFGTAQQDFEGRIAHWSRALKLLDSPTQWAFGKGTGRYPANHFLSGNTLDQTGDYRLVQHEDRSWLALSAGKHTQGWGEIFRVSQRVDSFDGTVTVAVDVRSGESASLHAELCPKHLLYDGGGCMVASVKVAARPEQWQTVTLILRGEGLDPGAWFAPRFIVFSLAVDTPGRSVEVDNLSVVTTDGRDLLRNGDFSQGMARWFFSSDRHHLPWHMKNMLLHVLFEQGWVGLSLFTGLLAGALWRTCLGAARDHPLAPPVAAGLAGFIVVGLFDSLLDAPRIAWLGYLLMLIAHTLPRGPRADARMD